MHALMNNQITSTLTHTSFIHSYYYDYHYIPTNDYTPANYKTDK